MSRNIRLLELYNIFLSALFIMPVLIPYYRDEIGLTFQHFLWGEAIFAGVVVALEVPTGWLSDIWRRKSVLIAAALFWCAGFAAMMLADSFADTIISQVLIGISVSLFSGTMSAMLYDSLLAEGRAAEYSRLEGRRFGVGFYSIAIASMAGGFLYEIHPQVPMAASALMALPAAACAMLMTEPPRVKKPVHKSPLHDMAVTIKYAVHGHAEIGFIIIFAGLLFSGTKLIMWAQQPYYMALDLPEYSFGLLMAVGYMLAGASSHLAHRLDGKVSNLRALSYALLTALVICLASGWDIGLHGVALLMFGSSFLYGMASPRVCDAINQRVDSSRRATILSTVNLLRELFFIPLSLAIGYCVTRNGIDAGLYAAAGWLALAGLFLVLWAARRRRVSLSAQS